MAVFVEAAAAAVRVRGGISVLLTGDREIRRLNREFRHKDKATDVLSFPVIPHEPTKGLSGAPGGQERAAGDVAISVETAARQAEEQGHRLAAELRILALHGLLHLAGFDHETDAGRMARKEAALRRRFGLAAGLIERSARPARRATAKRGSRQ
ncbi:MAG: rRNA maturation RNase YbeY [Acidobacteriaceae bacterium]